MKLYSFFHSSAAYRVRIALALKEVGYETVPIHLSRNGGENRTDAYRAVNPQMKVPALGLPSGDVLVQSLAIIDWLDETFPDPPFLPKDPIERAHVRGVALAIACDIHPLNNTAPLRYLKRKLGLDQAALDAWYAHWIAEGFTAIEQMIRPGPYAFGDRPGLADIFLVPQVANARRVPFDFAPFPRIVAVDEACRALPEFQAAHPANQPDAE